MHDKQKAEFRNLVQFLRMELADTPKTLSKHNEIGTAVSSLEQFVIGLMDERLKLQDEIAALKAVPAN